MVFIQIANQREVRNMNQYLKISTLIVTALAAALLFTSFQEVFNPSPWGENEDYLFPVSYTHLRAHET